MYGNVRRKLAILLVALIALTISAAQATQGDALRLDATSEDVGWRNYIFVIDNSASTSTNTRATGPATDPMGRRFSASSSLYGRLEKDYNRVGLIVFGGTNDLQIYGPVERGAANADAVIASNLNPAKYARGALYTDINTALQQALVMARSFENGDTNIILLTDGVNDLTNSATATEDRENLQANDRTVETARQIADSGYHLYIVALTAEGESSFRNLFMSFINRMAEAAGGTENGDGKFDNVFEAHDANLIEAFTEIFSRGTGNLSDVVELRLNGGNTEHNFNVPYSGITEASINITFAVEDKQDIRAISLVRPNGSSVPLWRNGGTESYDAAMYEVLEGQDYVLLKIMEPESGAWKVVVEGKEGVRITEYFHMSQNVRLVMTIDGIPSTTQDTIFRAWFQKYENGSYVNIDDSEIYSQSRADITFSSQDGSQAPYTVPMLQDGSGFVYTGSFSHPGQWLAAVTVSNDYLEKSIDQYGFSVADLTTPTPEPTPTPTPEPTPTPTPEPTPVVGEIRGVSVEIYPERADAAENGLRYVDATASNAQFRWSVDGEADAVTAAFYRGSELVPFREYADVGFAEIPMAELGRETCRLQITVVPKNGAAGDAVVHEERFAAYYELGTVGNISVSLSPERAEGGDNGLRYVERGQDLVQIGWQVEGDVESTSAQLFRGDETSPTLVEENANSLNLSRAQLGGDNWRVVVTAIPKNGTEADAITYEQTFAVYPEPAQLANLRVELRDADADGGVYTVEDGHATVVWSVDGQVDHFTLRISSPNHPDLVVTEKHSNNRSHIFDMPENEVYTISVRAIPLYGEDADGVEASVQARPRFLTPVQKLMKFLPLILGGIAGVGLIAGLIAWWIRSHKPKMSGTMRIVHNNVFYAVEFNKFKSNLLFCGRPLSEHPVIKTWQQSNPELFALVGGLYMNMTQTNETGVIDDEFPPVQHKVFNAEAFVIEDREQSMKWFAVQGEPGVTANLKAADGTIVKVVFQNVVF